jgi:hypothetical protein
MSPSPSMHKFCKNFLKIYALEINVEFRFIDRNPNQLTNSWHCEGAWIRASKTFL